MRPSDPEVLVVGGGPAGSTVAGLLARAGRDVLVVDRTAFPRAKPCGECLNPGAVAALGRLGLLDAVLALEPARLDGWRVVGARREARADFGRGLHGLGVARPRLDAALLDRARGAGARLLERARVEGVAPARDGMSPEVEVRLLDGATRTLRARVVVGADGLRSRVARSLGLATGEPGPGKASLTCRVRLPGDASAPTRGTLRVRGGVTVGSAPVHRTDGTANLTVVVDAARHRAELAGDARAFVERIARDRMGGPPPEILDGPWASGPFRHAVSSAWAPGVALVGDAAGYYDPFTGQGIYRALRSAELAAEAVLDVLSAMDARPGGTDPWAPLRRYGARWRREVAPGRRVQRIVDAVMTHAWLREPALAALGGTGLLPGVIRVTGDAAPVSSLFNPLDWAAARE